MSNKIFVGGINWNTNEEALENKFAEIGQVTSVKLVYDRETGRSRGFGFVEYATPEEAGEAVSKLDGVEFEGRNIKVSIAKERNERGGRGGGSGGRNFGGGGGNRNYGGGGGGGNRW